MDQERLKNTNILNFNELLVTNCIQLINAS